MEFEKKINNYFDSKVRDIEVDVEQKVMERISDKGIKPLRYNTVNYKIVIIASILIFILGTGFIFKDNILDYLGFNNKDGELEWSIRHSERGIGDYDTSVAYKELDKLELKEGEAAVAYIADNNPENITVSRQIPIKFYDLNSVDLYKILKKETEIRGYRFDQGVIYYDTDKTEYINELFNSDRKTNIVKKIKILPSINHVDYQYRNKERIITVQITYINSNELSIGNILNADSLNKIMLGDSEVLYEEVDGEYPTRQISWVQDRWYFRIISSINDINKEDFISFVEEIKTK